MASWCLLPNVHRRLTLSILNIAIAVALFFGSGAQWFILQSVAWTNMLVAYSQEAPLVEAVRMTFDGEHPCQLCDHIRSADKEIRQDDATTASALKPFLPLEQGAKLDAGFFLRPPTGEHHRYPQVASSFPIRSSEPLSPPPRG